MPTRKLKQNAKLQVTQTKLENPRHENSSEVRRPERDYEAKLSALRTAIDEGDASGIASGNPFSHVRSTIRARPQNS